MTINQIKVKGVTLLLAFRSPSNSFPTTDKRRDFLNLCSSYQEFCANDPKNSQKLEEISKTLLNFASYLDIDVKIDPKNRPMNPERKILQLFEELNGVELNAFVKDLLKAEILLEDVHVRFEDDETHKQKQFAFGASLQVSFESHILAVLY